MDNLFPMLVAAFVAIANFTVVLLNLPIDKPLAKFFVAANFVLGTMNLVTACKFLLR